MYGYAEEWYVVARREDIVIFKGKFSKKLIQAYLERDRTPWPKNTGGMLLQSEANGAYNFLVQK